MKSGFCLLIQQCHKYVTLRELNQDVENDEHIIKDVCVILLAVS